MTWILVVSGVVAVVCLGLLAVAVRLLRILRRRTTSAEQALRPLGGSRLSTVAWRAAPAPVGVGVLRLYEESVAFAHGASGQVWQVPRSVISAVSADSTITTDLGTTTSAKPALHLSVRVDHESDDEVTPDSEGQRPSTRLDHVTHIFALESECEPWLAALGTAANS